MKKVSRRRIVLIDRKFQLSMIVKFVALNVAIMCIFGIMMYLFLDSEIESNLLSAHVTYRNIKGMLMPIVLTLSIINIVFSSIVTAGFILFASHKIAGPLYRFTAAVDEMAERNFSVISKIRDGDQLLECSISLGGLISAVSRDIVLSRRLIDELDGLIEKGKDRKSMKKAISSLRDIFGEYKID